jgi:hypothetical protein
MKVVSVGTDQHTRESQHPVIIGGSSGSGSTLLAAILNRHQDIACGEELSCFDKESLYEKDWRQCRRQLMRNPRRRVEIVDLRWKRPLFDGLEHYGIPPRKIKTLAAEAANLHAFFLNFGRYYLQSTQKNLWVEKTPSNVFCIHRFLDLFPKGRAIIIMRDGRDCVLSMLRRQRSLYFSAWIWICAAAAAKKAVRHHRSHMVKYEDLVTEPEKTLKAICEFLGVAFTSDILFPSTQEKRTKMDSWSSAPSQAISNVAVGNYRKQMDRDMEKALFSFRLTEKARNRYGVDFEAFAQALTAWGYSVGDRTYPTQTLEYRFRLPPAAPLKRLRWWLKGKQSSDHTPQDLVTSTLL